MADVFLSYKSEDRELVATLAHALEQAGISVWWDKKIVAGGSWRETIATALAQAKVVIVAWSKRTENSSDAAWVFNEVDEAQRKKLPIIPVQLEPCDIPLGYRHVQAANLAGWRGDAKNPEWQEVLDGVRAAIEGRAVGGATSRRAAPAAPAPKRGGSPVGAIIALVALIVLAGGGYFAWPLLAPRAGETTQIASQSAVQIGPGAVLPQAAQPTTQTLPATSITPPVTPPPVLPITMINFKTGDGVTGSFRREQGDAWGEYTAKGERAFQFKQSAQTADKLELFDASRNMTITIDLAGKRTFWREGAGPNNPLYEVVSVER